MKRRPAIASLSALFAATMLAAAACEGPDTSREANAPRGATSASGPAVVAFTPVVHVGGELHLDRCGGKDSASCPSGYECVDDPKDGCDLKTSHGECQGFCVGRSCGASGEGCASGYRCVDDPADDCVPKAPGEVCPGICQASQLELCGGIEMKRCPIGMHCVDDSSDGCNATIDATCPGVCFTK